MDLEQIASQLAHTAHSIEHLATGIPDEQADWQPDPESWSILGVMVHMFHEEIGDFRHRLAQGLGIDNPRAPVPADFETGRGLDETLALFLAERERSLAWLRGLDVADWQTPCPISNGSTIPAGSMLLSWPAHDLLHLRQLIELHYAWSVKAAAPYALAYAGDW